MTDDQILGIYCHQDKKFYYLQTGAALGNRHTIDKLRTILGARGIISLVDRKDITKQHQMITLAQAKYEEYDIEEIFINNHTQKVKAPLVPRDLPSAWD